MTDVTVELVYVYSINGVKNREIVKLDPGNFTPDDIDIDGRLVKSALKKKCITTETRRVIPAGVKYNLYARLVTTNMKTVLSKWLTDKEDENNRNNILQDGYALSNRPPTIFFEFNDVTALMKFFQTTCNCERSINGVCWRESVREIFEVSNRYDVTEYFETNYKPYKGIIFRIYVYPKHLHRLESMANSNSELRKYFIFCTV